MKVKGIRWESINTLNDSQPTDSLTCGVTASLTCGVTDTASPDVVCILFETTTAYHM